MGSSAINRVASPSGKPFSSASTVLVFSVSELLQMRVGDSTAQLARHDCLQLDGNTGLVEVAVNAACCVIELTAR